MTAPLYIMAAVGFLSMLTCVVLVVAVIVHCWRNPVERVEPVIPQVFPPASVADGVDWKALTAEARERHLARRRGVTHV